MKKYLLASAAIVAMIGCSTFAFAQTPGQAPGTGEPGKAETHAPAAQPQTKGAPGNNMAHPQAQTTPANPGNQHLGQSGETPEHAPDQGMNPKSQERMGQSQEERTQEQKTPEHMGQGHQTQPQEHTGQNREPRDQTAKSVQLSREQQTRIKTAIDRGHVARAPANVHFSVTVGAVIPRTVEVAVLPADVVTIVPQYEGFDYIVVGDQILIVDPNTMEIVAVLAA